MGAMVASLECSDVCCVYAAAEFGACLDWGNGSGAGASSAGTSAFRVTLASGVITAWLAGTIALGAVESSASGIRVLHSGGSDGAAGCGSSCDSFRTWT